MARSRLQTCDTADSKSALLLRHWPCSTSAAVDGSEGSVRMVAVPMLSRDFRRQSTSIPALWWCLAVFGALARACFGQTVFLDFNTSGQYTSNFNPWNDAGGVNGGNYSF